MYVCVAQAGLVSSPTYGGSLLGSGYRVLGTLVGAVWAIVSWVIATAGGRWPDAEASPWLLFVPAVAATTVAALIKGGTSHFRLGSQIMVAYTVIVMAVWYAEAPPSTHALSEVERDRQADRHRHARVDKHRRRRHSCTRGGGEGHVQGQSRQYALPLCPFRGWEHSGLSLTRPPLCAHTHAHTYSHTRTHPRTHTPILTHTHANTHIHARTHDDDRRYV
jgi:hypothetical protein